MDFFDGEIKKLRAEILLHVEKTKIMLEVLASQLIELLRTTFYNSISKLPEWLFMVFSSTTPKHLHPG